MVIKCNYSEKLNFLQAQKCNAHLCHHLARGENHSEPLPLQTEKNQFGLRVPSKMQGLSDFQPLAHKTSLAEPTHSHPFHILLNKHIKEFPPPFVMLFQNTPPVIVNFLKINNYPYRRNIKKASSLKQSIFAIIMIIIIIK